MIQKLVLFIALVLTLAQGAAAATANFTAHVGWTVDSTLEVAMTPVPKVAVVAGDVDGDGRVTVADVTALIDYLLTGDIEGINPETADVDGDGKIAVADVTALIDIILGVPQTRLTTFLIVTMTDGTTKEYPIDEYSTVKIAKPNLFIQTNTETQVYDLELVANLRYDERMVTLSNKLANDHLIEQYRDILKTLQP